MRCEWSDIVVNKITGSPRDGDVQGERLAAGDEIGRVWSDPDKYNRKPTGIVSVGGDLYLAVQDLNKDEESGHIFNEAPAATIYKSTDKGRTWTAGPDAPMFDNHRFTTVMFLDYGKDGADNVFDDYVYAYGMDIRGGKASASSASREATKALRLSPSWKCIIRTRPSGGRNAGQRNTNQPTRREGAWAWGILTDWI